MCARVCVCVCVQVTFRKYSRKINFLISSYIVHHDRFAPRRSMLSANALLGKSYLFRKFIMIGLVTYLFARFYCIMP